MKSRIISGVIALIYLVVAYLGDGGEAAFKVGIFLVLPLACIWFGEEMGNYSGMLMGGGPMNPTPGWLVAAGGWLLLLLPVILAAIFGLKH
jgi:hypothetical protein